MEASIGPTPSPKTNPIDDPLTQTIKLRLLNKGMSSPTPKTIHILRKKELQKRARKAKKLTLQSLPDTPTKPHKRTDLYLQRVSREYKEFTRAVDLKANGVDLKGRPWEPLGEGKMGNLGSGVGGKLNYECLRELGLVFKERKNESLSLFLDDDVDEDVGMDVVVDDGECKGVFGRNDVSENEVVGLLVDRLSAREITAKDWKFRKVMKESGLRFLEGQMLRIVGGLGDRGSWKQAMEVVEWVYSQKEHTHYKSRFVYTKLLAVLGKARRPHEALKIFRKMLGDRHIYPDMAAYHNIAVTLGQAGMVRDLMTIIESMKEKPSKTIMNMQYKNWDPSLQPDIVVFNSVLNACVPSRQWKAVSWVFEQLRKEGLKANSATYGLAMEVMLKSEKYDLVHDLFLKMKRNGHSLKALTYKVLVKSYWKEGKVDEAIHIVRDMEQKGIIGSASVYYELACCLCNNGRWREAVTEIEKLKNIRHSKPLAVAYTGMILSAMGGGHIDDCTSIFKHMQKHCAPNIGTINAMLKVYGRNDMFFEAKELFEEVKRSVAGHRTCIGDGDTPLIPDVYTYSLILEASSRAHQWEYFEYIYKEMCVFGYNIDQDKHAALLVEASRAGKWHLLEHAFDTTLEAGGIPHMVLFSEMVLRATSHGDYEKASSIVSAMVHAPFQLNMKDWTDLIEKNKDEIGDEHLMKLYDTLNHHEISEQSSASELVKALHVICVHESLPIVSCTHNNDTERLAVNFDCDQVPQYWSKDRKESVYDRDGLNSDYNANEDDTTIISFKNVPVFAEFQQGGGFDKEVNDGNEVESPSADEILRIWKQMRKEDTKKFSV